MSTQNPDGSWKISNEEARQIIEVSAADERRRHEANVASRESCANCGRTPGVPTRPCPDCPDYYAHGAIDPRLNNLPDVEVHLKGTITGKGWADEAMFAAAPLTEGDDLVRPHVTLLSMTPNPLRVMAAVNQMYKGDPVHDPDDVPREMALGTLHNMQRTRLQAPMEWIHLSFLFEGVSRPWSQQLERQRTAAYAQESLRFAVKENAEHEVVMPPYFAALPEDDELRREWQDHVKHTSRLYNRWISRGVPAEDARGGLLMNTATRVHYTTNLRNLAEHAGYRLCSQAQHEWKLVWDEMIKEIECFGPPEDFWQQEAIAGLFKPICYQTGKCEFMASPDRYCVIRDRVEAHHAAGDPPVTWVDIDPQEPLHYAAARRA